MVYRFLLFSDEADEFMREIQIDSDSSFLDLHNAIIEATEYATDQMSSFFICDEDWNRKTEITLIDMKKSSEEDNFIMEDTPLEEFLEDEGQKLLYIFDYMTERAFFIKLQEIIPGKTLPQAICSRSKGTPPPQTMSFDDLDAITTTPTVASLLGESFYGDSDYNPDELDSEGFDGLDNIDNSFEEERY
jgi:hypothetical protein